VRAGLGKIDLGEVHGFRFTPRAYLPSFHVQTS
jgi:hypothetical protein